MDVKTFVVGGMNCGNCVTSLSQKVSAVAGVTGVEVDLPTGRMEVTAHGALDESAVRQVVTDAGFQVS
ncbi:heavy-metal-associated domain-containing protein [Acrocarpospora catenulata]|uniref:heavy-metal-associated domain-containing protein n=1 Tax=Acrocarpospora catenulata TaxID=2836182 RepID=UPI001BDA7A01|nr:heavy metal-associated domain-containing protein [Acrocarpospora catenulata]